MINRLIAPMFLLLLSCPVNSTELFHLQIQDLEKSLEKMLIVISDRFVIVEIPNTANYFQYTIDDEGFIFDLPVISLSSVQKSRAEKYFEERGIEKHTISATNPENLEKFNLETYIVKFDQNQVTEGSKFGIKFASEVLQFDGKFKIVQGWD